MREDHWDPIETMGRHRQHREGGPTFQAGSSQQIVQAGAVVPQIVGRQPDGQQVLVRHVCLVDADNKVDVLVALFTVKRSDHRHASHCVRLYTSG